MHVHCWIQGGRQGRAPSPVGPNSFIFIQFSAKKLKNNNTFGSWRTPLGKILDPTLMYVCVYVCLCVYACMYQDPFCPPPEIEHIYSSYVTNATNRSSQHVILGNLQKVTAQLIGSNYVQNTAATNNVARNVGLSFIFSHHESKDSFKCILIVCALWKCAGTQRVDTVSEW